MKDIFKLMKESNLLYKFIFIVIPILFINSIVFNSIDISYKYLIDNIMNIDKFIILSIVLVVLIILKIIMNILSVSVLQNTMTYLQAFMINKFNTKLTKIKYKYFIDKKESYIISCSNSIYDIIYICEDLISSTVIIAVTLSISIYIFVKINSAISYFVLIICNIILAYLKIENKKLYDLYNEKWKAKTAINQNSHKLISCFSLVRTFPVSVYEQKNIEKDINHLIKVKRHFDFNIRILENILSLLRKLLSIGVIIIGGYQIYKGNMTIGDLFLCQAFANNINEIMSIVNNLSINIQDFNLNLHKYMEILNEEDDEDGNNNLNSISDIEFKNVSFSYDEKLGNALSNFNLKVNKLDKIGICGNSGSGKSTFAHILMRFYKVDKGEILINNKNINNYTIDSLHHKIGLIQQDTYIFADTILQNIKYGNPNASMNEIADACKQADIYDFIMGLPDKFDTLLGEKGIRLSGGQKQKISIARVLLLNPDVIICDEATSALDNISEKNIQNIINKLDKTVIIIAHRLTTLECCNKIIVVNNSEIVEEGNGITELLQNKSYFYNLWNKNNK